MTPPFSAEQFLDVFVRYHEAVWPIPMVWYALAAGVVWMAGREGPRFSRWIGAALASLWAWMGAVYHWGFFTEINPAAWLFGGLFVLQAVLLVVAGVLPGRLSFRLKVGAFGITGGAFIAYALFVYPLLGALAGHAYPRGPTLGLPCPTTIFTLGVLLWAEREVPWWVLVIPFGWSILGISAAASFGMMEDYGLLVAGLLGTAMMLWKNRHAGTRQSHPWKAAVPASRGQGSGEGHVRQAG